MWCPRCPWWHIRSRSLLRTAHDSEVTHSLKYGWRTTSFTDLTVDLQLFGPIFLSEMRSNEGRFSRNSPPRLNFFLGISPVLWCFQCTDGYSSGVFQIVAQRAGETQVRGHPSDLWPPHLGFTSCHFSLPRFESPDRLCNRLKEIKSLYSTWSKNGEESNVWLRRIGSVSWLEPWPEWETCQWRWHTACSPFLPSGRQRSLLFVKKKYWFLFLIGFLETDLKEIWYSTGWSKSLAKQWTWPSAQKRRPDWACPAPRARILSLRTRPSHVSE